jgi:cell shape-determining protein MreC
MQNAHFTRKNISIGLIVLLSFSWGYSTYFSPMAVWSREAEGIREQISTLSGTIQSNRESIEESERSIRESKDMMKRYQEYLEKGASVYGDT